MAIAFCVLYVLTSPGTAGLAYLKKDVYLRLMSIETIYTEIKTLVW